MPGHYRSIAVERGTSRSWSAGSASRTGSGARSPSTSAPTSRSAASRPGRRCAPSRPPGSASAAARRSTVVRHPLAPDGAAGALRGARRPQRGRGGPRHRAARHTRPGGRAPEDPDEFYDHQLVGLAAYDEAGPHLGEVTAVVHGAAQDLLTVRTLDGRDTLVPFVGGAGARGRRRRRPGRRRRPPGPGRAVPRRRRAEPRREDRRRLDLPDYLAPLELSLPARPATRACSTCTCTTCATGPTTGTAPSTTRRTAAAPAW